MSDAPARILPAGRESLLVEVASVEASLRLYAAARVADLPVTDLVPAARSVLFDGVTDLPGLRAWLARRPDAPPELDGGCGSAVGDRQAVIEVPTCYDGVDLLDIARAWDMTVAEVVATHTGVEHRVAFCGFVPGFAYCTGLPPGLRVARLPRPRPRVPAGSVAVAAEFTGVYPTASPGGWRLLGRTALVLWDATSPEQPATLVPGARVRFTAVGDVASR